MTTFLSCLADPSRTSLSHVVLWAKELKGRVVFLRPLGLRLNIPIIAICNTNADPDNIDIVIPANNYSIKSVYLIIGILADAIALGQGKIANYIGKSDSEIILPESKNQNQ